MQTALLAMFVPGPMELVIVGLIAVLLFGNRLPDMARNVGAGIGEFKKGIRGIESEIDQQAR